MVHSRSLHGMATRASAALFFILCFIGPAQALELDWLSLTGRWYVETAPLVADIDGDGSVEILAVNLGGNLMRWNPDGTPHGSYQDRLAAQLPEGTWASSPVLVPHAGDKSDPSAARVLLCSIEGTVVALDGAYRQVWEHALSTGTTWGRALPAIIDIDDAPAACYGDHNGEVVCLSMSGDPVWHIALDGKCEAPLQTWTDETGADRILFAAGTQLHCLDSAGTVVWSTDLGGRILSRPEVLALAGRQIILCGAGAGSLFALDPSGSVLWKEPIDDEIDASIVFMNREDNSPLILCTGLWGNLHALDIDGNHVWTHRYSGKGRGAPTLFDADGDGDDEILVSTYAHHLLVFDHEGRLVDDLLLGGEGNTTPTIVPGYAGKGPGVAIATGYHTLLRYQPGPARSIYGVTADPEGVTLQRREPALPGKPPALIVNNPRGALLQVNATCTPRDGRPGGAQIDGRITEQSAFELPLGPLAEAHDWHVRARVTDRFGRLIEELTWDHDPGNAEAPPSPDPNLRVWPTPPYGTFDETRLHPREEETAIAGADVLRLDTLYRSEADQVAFVVASGSSQPTRARIVLEKPVNADGTPFPGRIALHEAVVVGSANGNRVADPLPDLGDARLMLVPPHRAAKIWISIDSRDASGTPADPGMYLGSVAVTPLDDPATSKKLPLRIEVLDLALPDEFPLSLCTWDYIPNKWFPNRTPEVLDGMARHGVNVFPRPGIQPPATVNEQGELVFDWANTDKTLAQLDGRGVILIHLHHPPIKFATPRTDEAKHEYELAYLRAFRDHLKEKGRGFEDYLFYPADEPGWVQGKRVQIIIDTAKLLHEADPGFLVYANPVMGLSWYDFERLAPWVDQWCPIQRIVPGVLNGDPRMQAILQSDRPVWSYECYGGVKTVSPLCYNRANSWRAHYFGLDGIGFWTFSTTAHDLWMTGETPDAEFPLVYPGELPVPSARWEAVRDGLEDVAAMELLEQRIAACRAAGDNPALVAQAEEALRIAQVDILEMSDTAFTCGVTDQRQGRRLTWHTWSDVAAYAAHRKRIAELTLAFKEER